MTRYLDVTDFVEFLEREESVSGVQRVIARTAPLVMEQADVKPVMLDRFRGVFVPLTHDEAESLIIHGTASERSRAEVATLATACRQRIAGAQPLNPTSDDVMVFLGAVWINDALMLAARNMHSSGVRCIYYLYDLTPVFEAGHTAGVHQLFHRYLHLIQQSGARVPAISQSSRRDFETYCRERGLKAPEGEATALPCGITPSAAYQRPWSRPYALFVGTIEARKRHAFALSAWRTLIDQHGADSVPDLVCIGRLGWHSEDFLRDYVFSDGLAGKVVLVNNGVTDEELAQWYEHAEFTIYPSRYEGWGLPVSESLAFGKVCVVARNSSLVEAGGDLADYFTTDDQDDFVRVINERALDLSVRGQSEERIAAQATFIQWQDVADALVKEIEMAEQSPAPPFPEALVELGHEYVLSRPGRAPDPGFADQTLHHIVNEERTPLLAQPRSASDYLVTDAALTGAFGSPQVWGLEVRPHRPIEIRFARPSAENLVILFATRSMPGFVTIESISPAGPIFTTVPLGGVFMIPLGAGHAGEPVVARFTVTDASAALEGFMGIRSFIVMNADDARGKELALHAAAESLRQELDAVLNTRSWKVTAPLRRWKGRGR